MTGLVIFLIFMALFSFIIGLRFIIKAPKLSAKYPPDTPHHRVKDYRGAGTLLILLAFGIIVFFGFIGQDLIDIDMIDLDIFSTQSSKSNDDDKHDNTNNSFADYLKEQDPDLYNEINNRYNSAVENYNNNSGSSSSDKKYGAGGYEMPNENDKTFSDYVKRVDPDLYDYIVDNYDSAVEDYYNSNNSGSSSNGSSSNKQYGAGGYEMPNENDKTFSDYVERVDPDLYNDIVDSYDSAVKDYNNSNNKNSSSSSNGSSSNKQYGAGGYEMPNENDKSFSDYIQRVDPDLYNDIVNNYNDAFGY